MTAPFDIIIRSGLIYDGNGGAPYSADIAVAGDRIAAIGQNLGDAHVEIDAEGMIVTPGFVDVHTHYDGHVTWEHRLHPSSAHGVTTAVIGNCGVGFAPCKPTERDMLIKLMEGVEDIPFPVLAEGLPWTWESYPEYLDFLSQRSYDMDFLSLVPHAALRLYVMGKRGAEREEATDQDIAQMCSLLADALDAGAAGIGTSRTIMHRSSDGKAIFTLDASDKELLALAKVLKDKGKGVFQIVEDMHLPDASLDRVRKLAEVSERPITFTIGAPNDGSENWRKILADVSDANTRGYRIAPQILPRGIGMMLGHQLTLNPFYSTPTYNSLAKLPLAERLGQLKQPTVRAAILSENLDPNAASMLGQMVQQYDRMFILGAVPDYEQSEDRCISALADKAGLTPSELAYDLMLEDDAMLYLAMGNYPAYNLDAVGEILADPNSVPGLGDGGAHCGTICDASFATFMLTHWARDRATSPINLPQMIKKLSRDTAELMGLFDRGELAIGKRADINVIDHQALRLDAPHVSYDLPGGMPRLLQRAHGYHATLVKGQIIYQNGEATGALSGRLIRA